MEFRTFVQYRFRRSHGISDVCPVLFLAEPRNLKRLSSTALASTVEFETFVRYCFWPDPCTPP